MPKKKPSVHYVDSKKIYDELSKYVEEFYRCKEAGLPRPRANDYIGTCILKIARGLSSKSNFSGYTYKEEMISDAIENCIAYMHNFNPEQKNGAFKYLTMIVHNSFIHRIGKEHKQTYIKYKKSIDHSMDFATGTIPGNSHSQVEDAQTERMGLFIRDYEEKLAKKKAKVLAKKLGIEQFAGEPENA